MELKVDVIKNAVIKELGASITTTENNQSKTTYSYIEFEDGRILKQVEVGNALNGKLQGSLGVPLDLHVASPDGKSNGIYAVQATTDGRLFAQDVPDLPFVAKILPLILFLFGIPLLMLLGAGLILWWMAWKLRQTYASVDSLRAYVRGLPNAVLVE